MKDPSWMQSKKTCIFINYGQDEFGCRLYDHVGKKLIQIRTVVFMEDQTIEDIDKVENVTPKKDISLSNVDQVQLPSHNMDAIDGDDHDGEPYDYVDDQQLGDEVNIPTNYGEGESDVSQDENLSEALESSQVQLKRSNKQRQPSTRYNSDEYVN